MQYTYRYNKNKSPAQSKLIPRSSLEKKGTKVQVRRAYMTITLKGKEQPRAVVGFAWADLRDQVVQMFQQQNNSQYELTKINRLGTTSKEKRSIKEYIVDIDAFLLAAKYDFDKMLLKRILIETIEELENIELEKGRESIVKEKECLENALRITTSLDLTILKGTN